MVDSHEHESNPYQAAEQLLAHSEQMLRAAVSIVSPENPEASPFDVFPAPGERRADDPGLPLDDDQQQRLRPLAAELGFGRETDLTLSEQGIRGAHVIIEGGQPHKMFAEASLILDDPEANPTTLIFSASPHRKITDLAELRSAKHLLGKTGKTEYDIARAVAERLPGFEKLERDVVVDAAYTVGGKFKVTDENAGGQFLRIGLVGKVPVILMRIDREDYLDDQGAPKYRNQPDTTAVMRIVDEVACLGRDFLLPVALVTSATYEPSRAVDVARAAVESGRTMVLASYGTRRLANVKGEALPAPAPINQLPGEFHKLAVQAERLRQVLAEWAPRPDAN